MTLPVLVNLTVGPSGRSVDELAAVAIDAGCAGLGLADSPRLFPDPFVCTEAVLSRHDAALAGPCVAALGLRPVGTVAGALGTLARRHPGRVLAVVGRGESSVRNEGLPVPGLAQHADALTELHTRLAEAPDQAPEVLLGAASGPRTIQVTAATLPGVLLDVGVDPGVVVRALGHARSAAPDAAVWLFLRAVVAPTEERAAVALAPILGSCAARLVAAPEWYDLDPPLSVNGVRSVAEAHDYRRHASSAGSKGLHAGPDAESLIRAKFLLSGTAEQIRAGLRPLAGLGIAGVILAGGVAGVWDDLAVLAAAVRSGLEAGDLQ